MTKESYLDWLCAIIVWCHFYALQQKVIGIILTKIIIIINIIHAISKGESKTSDNTRQYFESKPKSQKSQSIKLAKNTFKNSQIKWF